ncbi:MAG: hypothetical protein ACFFAT_17250 [Promethearchaeota archaeon]
MSFFEHKYLEAFKQLGIKLSDNDGVEEYNIGIQEQVLEIQLPKALRMYYIIAGNHELNYGHNELYSIGDIYMWENFLVFMKESNGMESWGIRLDSIKEIDPPIYAGLDAFSIKPYLQEVCCSDFLIFTLFSHAISGGFEHHEEVHIKVFVAQKIIEDWTDIGGGFYSSIGKIVYIPDEDFKEEEEVLVTIAGKNEKDFFDMVWDLSARIHYIT